MEVDTRRKMEVDTKTQMGGRNGGEHQEKSVGSTFRQIFPLECPPNFPPNLITQISDNFLQISVNFKLGD